MLVKKGGILSHALTRMTALSAEGAFGDVPPRKASPERGGAREAGGGVPSPTRRNGRGGSVSRRDLNQAARNRAHLAWAHKPGEKVKPIPSYSSGEGVRGRGASLREAASPGVSPRIPQHLTGKHAKRLRAMVVGGGGGYGSPTCVMLTIGNGTALVEIAAHCGGIQRRTSAVNRVNERNRYLDLHAPAIVQLKGVRFGEGYACHCVRGRTVAIRTLPCPLAASSRPHGLPREVQVDRRIGIAQHKRLQTTVLAHGIIVVMIARLVPVILPGTTA